MDLVTRHVILLICALSITIPDTADNCIYLLEGDTVSVSSSSGFAVDWYIALPVRGEYGNLIPGGLPNGLGVDTLDYRVFLLAAGEPEVLLVPDEDLGIPCPGIFYLIADPPSELRVDTVSWAEPLNYLYPDHVIQVVSRPSNDYIGYLFEMINTPFLMAPRFTPQGNQQADCRLGCDCAGLAVYGRRRMGFDIPYAGPLRILPYLTPVLPDLFAPDSSQIPVVYRSGTGESVPVGDGGIACGDIVHFGVQVSIFLEDRGVIGILDPEDMLIQSWFDGPHVCAIAVCGFYNLPIRLYRWD